MTKVKRGDMVEVIWDDSNIPEKPGWMSEEEHKNWVSMGGSTVRSVGIVIETSKRWINIVGDMDEEDGVKVSVMRPINIAKGFIRELHILKRRK